MALQNQQFLYSGPLSTKNIFYPQVQNFDKVLKKSYKSIYHPNKKKCGSVFEIHTYLEQLLTVWFHGICENHTQYANTPDEVGSNICIWTLQHSIKHQLKDKHKRGKI
jgi:hypothetical protein